MNGKPNYDLCLSGGETCRRPFHYRTVLPNRTRQDVDLRGCTVRFVFKSSDNADFLELSTSGTASLLGSSVSFVNAQQGRVLLLLNAEETAAFPSSGTHACWLTESNGDERVLFKGTFKTTSAYD